MGGVKGEGGRRVNRHVIIVLLCDVLHNFDLVCEKPIRVDSHGYVQETVLHRLPQGLVESITQGDLTLTAAG